jgi:hypothetical protein
MAQSVAIRATFARLTPNSCKFGKANVVLFKNDFWRSWQIWHLANLANCAVFKQGHFMYKKSFLNIKRSGLPSPNLPNLPNLPCVSHKINSKKVFLADVIKFDKTGKY